MMSPGSKESSVSSSVNKREVSKDILVNNKLHRTAVEASNTNLLGSHITLSHGEVFLVMTTRRRNDMF